jgi:hypothetical protein
MKGQDGKSVTEMPEQLCRYARSPNSPRSEQREQCALLDVESGIAGSDYSQMSRPKIVERAAVEILLDNRGADI